MLIPVHNDPVLISVGARTPLGADAISSSSAVRAGISAQNDHDFMIDKYGDSMVVCSDAFLPANLASVDRMTAIAIPAALEATAGLEPYLQNCVLPAYVALPEERPGFSIRSSEIFTQQFESALTEGLQSSRTTASFEFVRSGHAGGFLCLEKAVSALRRGDCSVCMVGGIESYLDPITLEWLDDREQLHSNGTIWGFCPSEGASFCMLCTRGFAESNRLSAMLQVASVGSAVEANRIKSDTVCTGDGLTAAFREALRPLTEHERVAQITCDMNGEIYRADEYAFATLRCPNRFAEDLDVLTPADCLGDIGAASSSLFVVLAAEAAKNGYNSGELTLTWASSESGLRGAALLRTLAI